MILKILWSLKSCDPSYPFYPPYPSNPSNLSISISDNLTIGFEIYKKEQSGMERDRFLIIIKF